ncbi:MAG: hypothetical protein Q8941_02445 [Bacteroidota bacterium]|nr:hypothetical protein [Bacteroidota bacterium]
MNSSIIYILIATVVFAAITIYFFLIKPGGQPRKLSPLASLAFAFIVAGIFFGEKQWLGYGLMGTGVLLAIADIAVKYRGMH